MGGSPEDSCKEAAPNTAARLNTKNTVESEEVETEENEEVENEESEESEESVEADHWACLSSVGGALVGRVSLPGAHLFKFLVVGNSKCGKSSLVQRYTRDAFTADYNTTIGSDFSRKNVTWDATTSVRVNLWDVAGQDRFAALTRPFFAGAVGAIVVCDVTRPQTLEAARVWKRELDERLDTHIPVILVANKCDLLQGGTKSFAVGARVAKTAADCGFSGWFVSSAKLNMNIQHGVDFLINEALRAAVVRASADSAPLNTTPTAPKIDLASASLNPKTIGYCC